MGETAQEQFDRCFKGVWKRCWWHLFAPPLVRIDSYRSGEITNRVVAVIGKDDHGDRVEIPVANGGLTGYRRLVKGEGPGAL